MLPPNVPGGITGCALAPAGQTPIVPMNGVERDLDVLAERHDVATREVEDAQVGLGELVGQQPEPGEDAVHPQPLVCRSRISIASVSPGSAPSTYTGPASG